MTTEPPKTLKRSIAANKASEFEICVQWYIPQLDPPDVICQPSSPELSKIPDADSSHCIAHLVYAMNRAAVTSSSGSPVEIGKCLVKFDQVQSLHKKLMSTLALAENDLQQSTTTSSKYNSSTF